MSEKNKDYPFPQYKPTIRPMPSSGRGGMTWGNDRADAPPCGVRQL